MNQKIGQACAAYDVHEPLRFREEDIEAAKAWYNDPVIPIQVGDVVDALQSHTKTNGFALCVNCGCVYLYREPEGAEESGG